MQPRTHNIAVMGGSAAGLYTAYLLAQRGRPVTVYEAAECLDPTPRCLIVTSRFRDLLGPLAEPAIVNEIRRFELYAGGRVGEITLKRPDVVIERARLIRTLSTEAKRCGAEVVFGKRFVHLEPNGTGLRFALEHAKGRHPELRSAGTIVGADGAFSSVARAAGWTNQATVPLIQAIVQLPEDLAPDTTRVWFRPQDTPYFYWLIPESSTRGVLGLIGEDGRQTRRALERFLAEQRLEPVAFQAARIPLYTRGRPVHKKIGNGDAFIVGDAAGQVKVTTVGGIVTGLRGALGVADAITNGGPGRELRALKRELDLHLLVRKGLHRFSTRDYSRLLQLLNPAARRVLGVFNRDETDKLLRQVLVRRPQLLLLGLRGLMANGYHDSPHGA